MSRSSAAARSNPAPSPSSPPPLPIPRVAIVGAGRAGLSLATALAHAGVAVDLIGRNPGRRPGAADWLRRCSADLAERDRPFGPVCLFDSVDHWDAADRRDAASPAPPTSTIVVATADRDLAASAVGLGATRRGRAADCWLHLSGVTVPSVLDAPGAPAALASCHPLCCLADPLAFDPALSGEVAVALATRPLRGAFFALAGSDVVGRSRAASVAELVGGMPALLDLAGRSNYHGAAAIVGNDLVALIAIGEDRAVAAGVSRLAARRGLLHLARTALDALEAASLDSAGSLAHGLTGAVGRGDAATIARHLDAFAEAPEAVATHRLLSSVLVALVTDAGLIDASAQRALAEVLAVAPDSGVASRKA